MVFGAIGRHINCHVTVRTEVEWQALSSLLDSFGIYLRRNKGGGYHRDMYKNMVRFLKKMMGLPPGNAAARAKLRLMITQTQYLAEREWLLSVLK